MLNKKKYTAADLELALVILINVRKYVCVCTNISWGWLWQHEADVLSVDSDNRVTEYEIKVSVADLKKDFEKSHGHRDKKVGRLYYVISEPVWQKAGEVIPKQYGVIVCKFIELHDVTICQARYVRKCYYPANYTPVSDMELIKLMRLQCMRIWDVKRRLNTLKTEVKQLRKNYKNQQSND